ncbi:uncharacterized protein GGS25DRAFT_439000 [Hypoxylon fragiforme]|uniref:uncharacterized protein n=1 Tax=Hypoxylon fragiforme TaxID=63214 RepID=UPI0020C63F95|nr:uncharacterized protein GGS25DRAFT_439000 [Hypoxylon fragiforme]KAI2603881.1 hypothetical protein GGS25DRAFT_439000 [Hypoxylon fragiforme]
MSRRHVAISLHFFCYCNRQAIRFSIRLMPRRSCTVVESGSRINRSAGSLRIIYCMRPRVSVPIETTHRLSCHHRRCAVCITFVQASPAPGQSRARRERKRKKKKKKKKKHRHKRHKSSFLVYITTGFLCKDPRPSPPGLSTNQRPYRGISKISPRISTPTPTTTIVTTSGLLVYLIYRLTA